MSRRRWVSVGPGATQLTVTPLAAYSEDSSLAAAVTAARSRPRGGAVDGAARDVEQVLAVREQQRDQQRGAAVGEVDRPGQLAAEGEHVGQQCQQGPARRSPRDARIYEKDTINPALPGTRLDIDPKELAAYRPSYRCLAWEDRRGYPVGNDHVGDDQPDAVQAQCRRELAWLDEATPSTS